MIGVVAIDDVDVTILVLGAFLELVASPGTGSRADGGPDDRARRAGHGCADDSAGHRATGATDPGARLFVALGGLAGHRAGAGAERTTDGGTDRAADQAADDGSSDGTGGPADGLGRMLAVTVVPVVVHIDIDPRPIEVAVHVQVAIVLTHEELPFLLCSLTGALEHRDPDIGNRGANRDGHRRPSQSEAAAARRTTWSARSKLSLASGVSSSCSASATTAEPATSTISAAKLTRR